MGPQLPAQVPAKCDSSDLGALPVEAPDFPREQVATLPEAFDLTRERLLTTEVTRVQLLRLAMKGLNATQAAKIVGCSAETARAHYASPDFRQAVLTKVEQAFEGIDQAFINKKRSLHEMLEEQATKSCEGLIELLEREDLHPSLKVRIHQDFLNRVEASAPQSKQHSYKMDPAELKHAATVASEMNNVIPFKKQA